MSRWEKTAKALAAATKPVSAGRRMWPVPCAECGTKLDLEGPDGISNPFEESRVRCKACSEASRLATTKPPTPEPDLGPTEAAAISDAALARAVDEVAPADRPRVGGRNPPDRAKLRLDPPWLCPCGFETTWAQGRGAHAKSCPKTPAKFRPEPKKCDRCGRPRKDFTLAEWRGHRRSCTTAGVAIAASAPPAGVVAVPLNAPEPLLDHALSVAAMRVTSTRGELRIARARQVQAIAQAVVVCEEEERRVPSKPESSPGGHVKQLEAGAAAP